MKIVGIGFAITAALLGSANYAAAESTSRGNMASHEMAADPLMNAGGIKWVQPVRRAYLVEAPLLGATVLLRNADGVSAESVRRSLTEHSIWMSHGGGGLPEMSNCPLAFQSENIRVTPGRDGVEVQITSTDPKVGAEIFKRLTTLATAGHGSPVTPEATKSHKYPNFD